MVYEPTEAEPQPDEVFTPGLAIAPIYPGESIQKSPSLLSFFIYAILAVVFFASILSVTYYYARKSRSGVLARLKEKSNRSGFDDIRFLAGDEDLDFHIAQGPEPAAEAMEAEKPASKDKKNASKQPAKQRPEAKQPIKHMAETRISVDGSVPEHYHARDDGDDCDESTDDEHGGSGGVGAKKTHSKTTKKPYQKYVKYHDEDMNSTLL